MKRALIGILGLLLAALLLVCGVGATLPRDHTATVRLTVQAPPERVYALIRTVEQGPRWRSDLSRVELLPLDASGKPRYREHGDETLKYVIDEEIPGRRMVTRIETPGPFGGRWVYELSPAQKGGTTLQITEEGWVSNVLFRFLSHFVFGHGETLRIYARDLDRELSAP
jgi:uncharacterized protein YndB with AHSA1/START domain